MPKRKPANSALINERFQQRKKRELSESVSLECHFENLIARFIWPIRTSELRFQPFKSDNCLWNVFQAKKTRKLYQISSNRIKLKTTLVQISNLSEKNRVVTQKKVLICFKFGNKLNLPLTKSINICMWETRIQRNIIRGLSSSIYEIADDQYYIGRIFIEASTLFSKEKRPWE